MAENHGMHQVLQTLSTPKAGKVGAPISGNVEKGLWVSEQLMDFRSCKPYETTRQICHIVNRSSNSLRFSCNIVADTRMIAVINGQESTASIRSFANYRPSPYFPDIDMKARAENVDNKDNPLAVPASWYDTLAQLKGDDKRIGHFFQVEPWSGTLESMADQQLTITFCPQWVTTVHAQLLVTTDCGAVQTIQLVGSCQHLHISLEPKVIDLASCLPGKVYRQTLRLINRGRHAVEYCVVEAEELTEQVMERLGEDTVFVRPLSGVVPAAGEISLDVCYVPSAQSGDFARYFCVEVPGEVPFQVRLCGHTLASGVQLGLPAVDHQYPDPEILEPGISKQEPDDEQTWSAYRLQDSTDVICIPQRTSYVLDFGFLGISSPITARLIHVLNLGEDVLTFSLKQNNDPLRKKLIVEFNRHNRLPPQGLALIRFVLNPVDYPLGRSTCTVSFSTNTGPTFSVVVKVGIEEPQLAVRVRCPGDLSHRSITVCCNNKLPTVNFGLIRCGHLAKVSLQLVNYSRLTCLWRAHEVDFDTIREGRRLAPKDRQALKEQRSLTRVFAFQPFCGTLQPGQCSNHEVSFEPQEDREYKYGWRLEIAHSQQVMLLQAQGRGIRPELELSTSAVTFDSIVPYTGGTEKQLWLYNPCPFPIDLFCRELDGQQVLETHVLQQVSEFQTMEKVRFPLRRLGGSLPADLLEAYRLKAGLTVMSPTGEVLTDVPSLHQPLGSQAGLGQDGGAAALLKQRLDAEAYEQQMNRNFGTKRELYQALNSALQTPVEKALLEYDHFNPATKNSEKKGIVVIVHGPPSCGKSTLATRLSHFYQLPLLHLDQIIMEAMQQPTEAIHHKILNFLVNPASVSGSGLPGAVRSVQTPPDADSRLRDNKTKANTKVTSKPAKSAVGHNKGLNATNDASANKERDPDLPFISKLIRYRNAQTEEMSELNSAIIPEDLLGQLITWRLQQADCARGVIFDDLHSDFSDNYPSTLRMLLAVVAHRQRVYSYILLNSFRQFRQRRQRRRRSRSHAAYSVVLRRMNRLRTLSEGHYRQLPRSTKTKTSLTISAYVDTLRILRDQRQRHRAVEAKQPAGAANKDTLGPQTTKAAAAASRVASSHRMVTASESGSVTPAAHKDMQSLETMSVPGGSRSIIRAAASARNMSVYKTKSTKPGTSHPATSNKDNSANRSKRDYWSMQPALKEDGSEIPLWKSATYRAHKAFFSTLKECITLINDWSGENKQDTKRASQKSENLNKDASGTIPVTSSNQKKRTAKGKEVRARTKESSEAERAAKDKAVVGRIKARYASKKHFGIKLVLLYRKYTRNGDDRLLNLDNKAKSHRWWYLPDLATLQAVTKAQLPLAPAQTYVLRSRPFVSVTDQGVSPDSPFHFVGEGSTTPSISPPLGAKASQYVAVSNDRVPSAQPKDPVAEANKPKGNTLDPRDRSRTAAKSAVKQRVPGSAMPGREAGGTSGTSQEVKAGKDDLSVLYPSFAKARKASEPDSKPLTNFRWSLVAHEKMYLRLNFHANKEGVYKERYNFEIVDYAGGNVALDVSGQCQYPNLFGQLSELFPGDMSIPTIVDERRAPVFVTTDQKLFFGPLLAGKKKSDVLADKWPQNVVLMTVRNPYKRALNAHLNIVKHGGSNPKDAKFPTLDFSIVPERFKVAGESQQVVRFCAHPAAIGRCEDTVLAFTDFNPAPVQLTLSALCIKPQAEVVVKNVVVEKVPLREMATGAIELRNKQGLVPVRWKLVGVDTLPAEFTFEAREGVLKATAQIQSIPVKFLSLGEKPVVHSKKPLKIEFSTDEPESTVLQTESLTISGESYDLILDITFPKMAEPILDFGVCRVKEEVTRQMTIKNKSKSDCAFQLVLALDEISVPSYPAAQLPALLEFQPASGTLSGAERPINVNIVFRPLAEIQVKLEKLVKCLVLDPSRGNQRVAEIPIKTVLAARYSRFVLNPPAGHMRFPCSTPGQKRARTITIQNTGDFDLQYAFKKLVSHVQNTLPPPRVDTPTLGKSLGGINSAVMAKASTASTHSNKKGEGAGSLLNSGMPFVVKPQSGTIKIGDTAQITVELGSDLAGSYDESQSLELSDRNPVLYPEGLTYHFSGEVASPSIDAKNIEDIFFEHRVLPPDVLSIPDSSLTQWLCHQSVYLPRRKHFFVQHTLVGTKRHLRFKLSNPTNLTTIVLVRLQPASGSNVPATGGPPGSGKGAPAASAIKANIEGFSISGANTIVIEPHRHAFLTLIYAPVLTNKYHVICDISIELSGPPTIRLAAALAFDIFAEGILPNLRFGLPNHIPANILPRTLYFYNTPVGEHHDLPLVIHNDTVIPVEASLSLTVADHIFAMFSGDDDGIHKEDRKIWQMALPAKASKQFSIRFSPGKLGTFKRYLELSCRESACPDTFLLLVGGTVSDERVCIDKLPPTTYEERARLITATEMNLEEVIKERYHLGFGDVCPGQMKQVTFDIVNRSAQWVRYEWTNLPNGLVITPKSGHLKPETVAHLQAKLQLSEDATTRHCADTVSLQLTDITVDDKYDLETVWNSDRQVLQVMPDNSKPNGEGETSQTVRGGDHGESDSDEHSKEGNKHETKKDPKKTLNAKTPSKDKKPTKKESISSESKGARKGTSKRRTSDQRKAADHANATKTQMAPTANNPQTEPSSHKVPLEDDKLKLGTIAATPSSVPPTNMDGLLPGQNKVLVAQAEPSVVLQTNTQRSLPLVVSSVIGFASYDFDRQEILLKDTNILEERRLTFSLKNTGLVSVNYTAQFCTDRGQCVNHLTQQMALLSKHPNSTSLFTTAQKNMAVMDRMGGDSSDESLSVQSLPVPVKGGKTGSRTPSGESSATRDGSTVNKKRGRKVSKDNAAMALDKILPVKSPPVLKGQGKEGRGLLASTPPQADKVPAVMPRHILPSHYQDELSSFITGHPQIATAFQLSPLAGIIPAGTTHIFTLSFRPEIPGDYLTALLIDMAMQRPSSLPLFIPVHVTARLPILHISSAGPDGVLHPTSPTEEDAGWTLSFDVVGTEGSVHSVLHLDNPTDQSYDFALTCLDHEDANKAPFEVSTVNGKVAAGKRTLLTVTFCPYTLGTFTSRWLLNLAQYPLLKFNLTFSALVREAVVTCSPPVLAFKPMLPGLKKQLKLQLSTSEKTELRFHMDMENFKGHDEAQWTVTPMKGVISPGKETEVKVTVVPKKAFTSDIILLCRVDKRSTPLHCVLEHQVFSPATELVYLPMGENRLVLRDSEANHVNLGPTEVHSVFRLNFQLTNTGAVNAAFDASLRNGEFRPMKTEKYLTLSVHHGKLTPGQSSNLTLVYSPTSLRHQIKDVLLVVEVEFGPRYVVMLDGELARLAVEYSFDQCDFGTVLIAKDSPKYGATVPLIIANRTAQTVTLDLINHNLPPAITFEFASTKLAAGNSAIHTCLFRPTVAGPVVGSLTFLMNGIVTKTIELKGQGVPLHVEVPSRHRHLVFKHAKVGVTSNLPFTVINRSLVEINGHVVLLPVTALSGPQLKALLDSKEVWLAPHSSIIVPVEQSIEASVHFKPTARITGFDARLCFVTDQHVIVELASVTGKCDGLDIVLDEQTVDFGAVVLGGWVKRNLLMRSQGELGAYFTWDTSLLAPHFTIKPDKGYIPAKGQLLLEVVFTPAFLSSDLRVLDIQCSIPHNKNPVKLNLIGACVAPVLPKEVFNFECPVRETDRKQLTITNTTASPWTLKPQVSNSVWTVPQTLAVRANSSEHFEAIFRPVESKPQQGLVTVILPAGQSQVFSLAGKTLPPKPNGRIGKEVPCRVAHKEVLTVNNWLQKAQSFNVTFEYIKPDKVDATVELTGNSMVHVPPMGQGHYELHFKALRDRDVNAVYTYKIVFKNSDGEYQYYDVQYKVGRGPMYDSKTITTAVRTSKKETVKIVNPLESNVTISCQLQGVGGEVMLDPAIPTVIPGKKEMDLTIEYFPLKPGTTQGRIDIGSSELGIFSVELNLHATAAKPEPAITLTAPLAGTATQVCHLRNYSRTKADFTVKILEGASEFQLLNEKATYSLLPGSSHNPTEMNLDIQFDPVKLGLSRGRIVASSVTGGEFVFLLEGTCIRPQPRGPFTLQSPATDLQPPLEVRNPFLRPCAFKVTSSNRAFVVRENTDVVKSKKSANIGVSFVPASLALDGETIKENSLLSQITVTPVFDGVPPAEEVVEWIYYIKCVL